MRVLYKVLENPESLEEFDGIEKYILTHFKPNYNLFSVTQVASLTNSKRGRVQRRVRKLRKRGLIKRHP